MTITKVYPVILSRYFTELGLMSMYVSHLIILRHIYISMRSFALKQF